MHPTWGCTKKLGTRGHTVLSPCKVPAQADRELSSQKEGPIWVQQCGQGTREPATWPGWVHRCARVDRPMALHLQGCTLLAHSGGDQDACVKSHTPERCCAVAHSYLAGC